MPSASVLVTLAIGGIGAVIDPADRRRDGPAADHQQQLGEEDHADQRADRQVLQEALPQLGEVDVEHHHDEQEQDRDRADIDDHQDHRQELGAQQHEQARRIDEGEDQEQHRVHRVPRRDDHHGRGDADAGEQIEEERGDDHARVPSHSVMPGARARASTSLMPKKQDVDGRDKPGHDVDGLGARSSGHRYGASSAMFLAISRSQRSPFASRRSLS